MEEEEKKNRNGNMDSSEKFFDCFLNYLLTTN